MNENTKSLLLSRVIDVLLIAAIVHATPAGQRGLAFLWLAFVDFKAGGGR